MAKRNRFVSAVLSCALGMAAFALGTAPASADKAGAFIGGVLATKVIGNMQDRTEAEQQQAAAAQSMANQQRSSSGSRSAEERIAELDRLAAGGYITPEEYKRKKQAIIDGL